MGSGDQLSPDYEYRERIQAENERLRETLTGLSDTVLKYHASSGSGKKELLDEVVYWLGQSEVVLNPTRESE